MLKWWYEYRFQRSKGCTVRLSLWRAFRYQPPPAIYLSNPAAERERARQAFRDHSGGQRGHPRRDAGDAT